MSGEEDVSDGGIDDLSDAGGCDEGDGGQEETGDDGRTNSGWAEAMAKILGKKTPESQTSILVKNKELDKRKAKERQEQLERRKQVTSRLHITLIAPHHPRDVERIGFTARVPELT